MLTGWLKIEPHQAPIAQSAEAVDLKSIQSGFESQWGHRVKSRGSIPFGWWFEAFIYALVMGLRQLQAHAQGPLTAHTQTVKLDGKLHSSAVSDVLQLSQLIISGIAI